MYDLHASWFSASSHQRQLALITHRPCTNLSGAIVNILICARRVAFLNPVLHSLEQRDPSSLKYPHGIHKYINLEVNFVLLAVL